MSDPKNATIFIPLKGEYISETLAQAERFLLIRNNILQFFPPVSTKKELISFLLREKVTHIFCGGIGNCMLEALSIQGIQVVPGLIFSWEEAFSLWKKHSLTSGQNFLCSHFGKTCGACSGFF